MNSDSMKNKEIPAKYRKVITEVLEKFPELQDVKIKFILKEKAQVPYGTTPDSSCLYRSRKNRSYTITIQEKADPPTEQALFANLTPEMQKGVIAHELVHVAQFHACNRLSLLNRVAGLLKFRNMRNLETAADRGAVEHGFGRGLYEHAVHIRKIPGYMQERPALHKFYLEPEEILAYMEALDVDKV